MSRKTRIPAAEILLDELCSSLTAANNYVLAAKRHGEHIAGADRIAPLLDHAMEQLQRSAHAYEGFRVILRSRTIMKRVVKANRGSVSAGSVNEFHY